MDPVSLSMQPAGALRLGPLAANAPDRCACCGHLAPAASVAGRPLCMTCVPAFALDEPDIDKVSALIWLPHLDQPVVSRLVTAVHTARAADTTANPTTDPVGFAKAAQAVLDMLLAQRAAAIARIGTDRPSVLRAAGLSLNGITIPKRTGVSALRFVALGGWFGPDNGLYQSAAAEWICGP